MRSFTIAICAAALGAALARADAPPAAIKAAPLEIQVRSAQTAASFPVYTGSGTAIRAADGEMPGVIVARDLESPKTRKLALVTLAVLTARSNVTCTTVVAATAVWGAGTSVVTTSSAEALPAVSSTTSPVTAQSADERRAAGRIT